MRSRRRRHVPGGRGHLAKLLQNLTAVRRVKNHPALPFAELPAFMGEFLGRDGATPAVSRFVRDILASLSAEGSCARSRFRVQPRHCRGEMQKAGNRAGFSPAVFEDRLVRLNVACRSTRAKRRITRVHSKPSHQRRQRGDKPMATRAKSTGTKKAAKKTGAKTGRAKAMKASSASTKKAPAKKRAAKASKAKKSS